MAVLIDGKKISAQVKDECKERVAKENMDVTLAVIQVGNDPASTVYVGNKKKACEYVGIHSLSYELSEETTEEELLALVEKLNADDTFKTVGQKLVDLLCGLKWGDMAWSLAGFFKAFSDALIDFPMDFVEGIGQSIVEHITGSKFNEDAEKKFNEKLDPIKKAYRFILRGLNPFSRISRDIEVVQEAFNKFPEYIENLKKKVKEKKSE